MSASSETNLARRALGHARPESLAECLRPRGPFCLELAEEGGEGGQTFIRARGEVDVLTAPKLAGRLDKHLRRGRGDIVVDLTEIEFLDSAGLHVLLNAQRRLERSARMLRVICAPGPVREVIEVARLLEALNVTNREQDHRSARPRARPGRQ